MLRFVSGGPALIFGQVLKGEIDASFIVAFLPVILCKDKGRVPHILPAQQSMCARLGVGHASEERK